VRTVKTSSGARAVQVVYSNRRGARTMEHIGCAHDEVELELLKTVARQRLAAGQVELDLGLGPSSGGPLPILGSRMATLVDALGHAYRVLGFEDATGADEVFAQLVLAGSSSRPRSWTVPGCCPRPGSHRCRIRP
jgi:hypothetical protein